MASNRNIFYALAIAAILLFLGTLIFNYLEGWSYVDSFYFSVITLTTIGYGDLTPTTDISKIIAAFYAILGIGVMVFIIGSVVGRYMFRQKKYLERIVSKVSSINSSIKARLPHRKDKSAEQRKE